MECEVMRMEDLQIYQRLHCCLGNFTVVYRAMEITHVVNCIGERATKDWTNAIRRNVHNSRRSPHDITFLNWLLYNLNDRENVDIFFNYLRILLVSPATRMFVHCTDGWGLSVGMAYGIMRICFDFSHHQAEERLQAQRYDTDEVRKPSMETMLVWKFFIVNA